MTTETILLCIVVAFATGILILIVLMHESHIKNIKQQHSEEIEKFKDKGENINRNKIYSGSQNFALGFNSM